MNGARTQAPGHRRASVPFSTVARTAAGAAALLHGARALFGRSRAALALMALTMALAALLASAGVHVWQGAPAAYEQLHASTGAPHAWFLLPDHPRRPQAAAAIGADPAVAGEVWQLPVATVAMRSAGDGAERAVDVRVYGIGPGDQLPGFAVTDGRWPKPGQSEALVDATMAAALSLEVGAEVELVGVDAVVPVRIVGEAVSALHCPYPECVPAPVLVPRDVFAQLAPRSNMLLGVRLHDPDTAPAFAFAVRRAAAALGVLMEAGNWRDLVAYQQLSHSLTAGFLLLAGALALTAGGAATGHAVAAAAIAGRRVMGLARAVGYTPRQLMGAFAVGCGVMGLVAGGLGAPVGWFVARAWFSGGLSGVSLATSAYWVPAAIAMAVAGASAALAGWSARRTAWTTVAATVAAAGGGVPVRLRLGFLGLPQLLVIRPVRPLVPAVAVAISVVVAVASVTLAHTLAAFGQDPAQMGIFHHLAIAGASLPPAEVDALVRSEPMVSGFHREAWARVDVPAAAASVIVRALDGDWPSLPWRVLDGRFVAGPREIALGTSAMKRLGVVPGDIIEVTLGPRRAQWRVSGAYMDLTNAGLVGAVTWETLTELYPGMQPAVWLLRLSAGADGEAVRQRLLVASGHRMEVTRAGFEPPVAVRTARRLVDGLALLLAGLALVAVVQGMTATVREQRRDIGILKAIGMTPVQLVAGTVAGIVGAAALGTAVGLVLGLALSWAGFGAASWVSGIGGLAPVFPWGRLAGLAAAAPAVAALVSLPAAVAAARVPAVQLGGETN